jgi:DNA-binding NtrC family response regulator
MREKILIVEDELIVAGDIRMVLERAGYEVCGVARSASKALQIVSEEKPFLVLLDIFLHGDVTGLDLANDLNRKGVPFVYISANCNHDVMEVAKRTQPYGFIVKPFRENDLLVTLDIARYRYEQNKQLKLQQSRTTKTESSQRKSSVEEIIGKSSGMLAIFDSIHQVAPYNTSVLILGESGTGKEGIACAIHNQSPRKNNVMVKVNCSALPSQLIESELFGHEKGAFTGAIDRRIGKFEKADGGTIFLDEIGDMPTDMQTKLLRVLQEKEIERIGSNTPKKIDVRVIAATNRDLEKEIAEGRFRHDLYYRLHVFPINVPALRDRREDIPLLTDHFINMFAERTGKNIKGVAPEIQKKLNLYHWPGNVRELQSLIERSVVITEGEMINHISLPGQNKDAATREAAASGVKSIDDINREHIVNVLKQCNYRIAGPTGAAKVLNLPVTTLASKIKKLGIVVSDLRD